MGLCCWRLRREKAGTPNFAVRCRVYGEGECTARLLIPYCSKVLQKDVRGQRSIQYLYKYSDEYLYKYSDDSCLIFSVLGSASPMLNVGNVRGYGWIRTSFCLVCEPWRNSQILVYNPDANGAVARGELLVLRLERKRIALRAFSSKLCDQHILRRYHKSSTCRFR